MGKKTALIIALICASIASLIVYRTINEGSKAKITEVPKTRVIYAKTTIPARTVVTTEQLEVRFIPKEVINQDSALKIEDVVGFTTKSEIIQGEQVNLNRLVRKGDNVGLTFIIPPGMRAITIPVNEVLGVAGFIKPGEKVDLIGLLQPKNGGDSISWTLLQDIEVLAVSQDMGNLNKDAKNSMTPQTADAKVGTSVTLAVTPFQAQKIVLSAEKGTIHLALRPALKEAEQNIPLIRESNLLPISKSTSPPRKTPSPKRVVEIISGGKSRFIMVD
jgi:pilus assembly protein CpaB